MAKKIVNREYLYKDTVNDAQNTLACGVQLVKTDNLRIKKRLDDNTIIYYVKGSEKSGKSRVKNSKQSKLTKTKAKRNVK